jgi:hypothetical protein
MNNFLQACRKTAWAGVDKKKAASIAPAAFLQFESIFGRVFFGLFVFWLVIRRLFVFLWLFILGLVVLLLIVFRFIIRRFFIFAVIGRRFV